MIVFFAIYFQIESVFLSPRIMKDTLNPSPLNLIIALSMGGAGRGCGRTGRRPDRGAGHGFGG
jgi:predicted PurR-regulated permease PerM